MLIGHLLLEEAVRKIIVISHHLVDDAESPSLLVDARRKLVVTFAK
jgi:hypothetical protein